MVKFRRETYHFQIQIHTSKNLQEKNKIETLENVYFKKNQ